MYDDLYKSTGLEVNDVWNEVKNHLDQTVIDAMSNKITDLSCYFNGRSFPKPAGETRKVQFVRKVQFIGVKTDCVKSGAKELAKKLTDIHNRYKILKCLAPALDLVLCGGEHMLLSYFALEDEIDLVKANYEGAFKEGGTP